MNQNKPAQGDTLQDELLTLQQAADCLQVTTRTIRNLIHDGELPAQRIGRSRMLRVRASALYNLLTEVRGADS
jgi:excisionase family DNA binding protein